MQRFLPIAVILALLMGSPYIISYYKNTQISNSSSTKMSINGDFELVNHHKEPVSFHDYDGKAKLVFFGFTNCPAICPTGLQNISNALNQLSDKERAKVAPLFISVDVEHDTPEQLSNYLSNFHPAIIGLTGTQQQIDTALNNYKAYAKKVDTRMGAMFDHSTFIYFMDSQGNYHSHLMHNSEAEYIAQKIREILPN